jgi:hypothetical protein
MKRTYDPNLDDVFVNRNGTIRWDGDEIGRVEKLEVEDGFSIAGMMWHATIGDPVACEVWPPYRASYAPTRKAAIAGVLEGLEVPE